MTSLRPETVQFLKGIGLALQPGPRMLARGSKGKQRAMGRARLYANRTHGGYTKAAGSPHEQMKRMMQGYHVHADQARRKMDLIDRIQATAPHLMPHAQALHQEIGRHLNSARTYHRLTMMTYGSGIKKARSHEWSWRQPRDKNGRWTQHAERMKHQGFLDKLRRLKTLAEDRAAPNATEMPGFFQRLAQIAGKVKKDMDVGDVHIAAALGGDKAGRRKKKYPPLSFARLPNGEVK